MEVSCRLNTIILKITGLLVERMSRGPNHSVTVLAVVAWGVIAMKERAGGRWAGDGHCSAGTVVQLGAVLVSTRVTGAAIDNAVSTWMYLLVLLALTKISDLSPHFSMLHSLISHPYVFSACYRRAQGAHCRYVLCQTYCGALAFSVS